MCDVMSMHNAQLLVHVANEKPPLMCHHSLNNEPTIDCRLVMDSVANSRTVRKASLEMASNLFSDAVNVARC